MESNVKKLVSDNEDRDTIFSSRFRTPRLPPVEELKVLKLWKIILELFELEAELAETHNLAIFDVVDEKVAEKECTNLTLVNTLRQRFGLVRTADNVLFAQNELSINSKPSKTTLQTISSSPSEPNSNATEPQKANFCRRSYWTATRDFHPDEIMLRFLVQQDWDIGRAFARLTLTAIFKKKTSFDRLLKSGEEGAMNTLEKSKDEKEREIASGFLRQCRVGKTFLRGHDWEGRPVVITRMRLNRADLECYESVKNFIIWQVECARLMLGPAITDVVGDLFETGTLIKLSLSASGLLLTIRQVLFWDFTGANTENLHLKPAKFLVEAFQKYFPCAFSLLILHNFPKFFQKSWDIIKGWLRPATVSKVKFTRSTRDIEQYIPRKNIIKELGGDDPWEFKYIPVQPGENDVMMDKELEQSIWEEYEGLWNEYDEMTRTMIDMASRGVDYAKVRKQRNSHTDHMRVCYWKLDPFIRARTYYDRAGDIGFRRESAFMTLKLTHGKDIDYRGNRLVDTASSGVSAQAITSKPSGTERDSIDKDTGVPSPIVH